MRLVDLCRLVQHYWKVVLAAMLFCSVSALLVSEFVISPKYQASSTITVSDPSNNVSVSDLTAVVNGFVELQTIRYDTPDSDVNITVSIGGASAPQTLTIAVVSPSEDESVAIANSIADEAAKEADDMFSGLQEKNESGLADLASLNDADDVASVLSGSLLQDILGSGRTFEFCSFMVKDAQIAQKMGMGTLGFGAIGLFVGFFIAVLALVIYQMLKAPIQRGNILEASFGHPVLNPGKAHFLGDQLWANIQFSLSRIPRSICLVPLSGRSARTVGDALSDAARKTGESVIVELSDSGSPFSYSSCEADETRIFVCDPVVSNIETAYCAHAVEATVLCVSEWNDSSYALESALNELQLAKARVVGIVILGTVKGAIATKKSG